MAQVNLYVPDPLYDELLARGADLNWSELFRERAIEALGPCDHRRVRCMQCQAVLST